MTDLDSIVISKDYFTLKQDAKEFSELIANRSLCLLRFEPRGHKRGSNRDGLALTAEMSQAKQCSPGFLI